MRCSATPLAGACILEPAVFADERGWFYEAWNQRTVRDHGIDAAFVQDNHSCTRAGVIRGLHWQAGPAAQGKLIRCVRGRIFDAIVDLRRDQPTFGRWFGLELAERDRRQLWVPVGFAHGFLALSDEAEVCYKTTGPWQAAAERGLRWDDPTVGIAWPAAGSGPVLHPRDAAFPTFDHLSPDDLF